MATIKPFKINISQDRLDELQARLEKTIWPAVINDTDIEAGPSLKYVKELVGHAQHKFNWREAEADINKYPQFTTEIDGQNFHFLHVKSEEDSATPLMLIHGWPGSFVEFLDVIEPLTNPVKHGGKADQAFDLVIPTLPGFGFSGPTKEDGWNDGRIAKALNELMQRLGYEKYGVQGADAGAVIAPEIARQFPKNIIGVHVNAATMGFIPMGPVDENVIAGFTVAEKERMGRLQEFMNKYFGFNMLHSSRPQSLSYAITDSPAGLMAWMSELFTNFGRSPKMVSHDRFLINFVIYWATGTAGSSINLYYQNAHDPNAWAPKANSGVPTGVAVFQEGDVAIRHFGEQGNNIVRWTEYEKGGHYAALEVPKVWSNDVREFFSDLR
ncbi:MAG TPA: epoxide hydrolase [Candidatus Saccharimonadales bacterium]